jgi:hypothetical protein
MQKPKALVLLFPGFASGPEDSTCLPGYQWLVRSLVEEDPSLRIL